MEHSLFDFVNYLTLNFIENNVTTNLDILFNLDFINLNAKYLLNLFFF